MERLVDAELQRQLADEQGLTDRRGSASTPVWSRRRPAPSSVTSVIEVAPEISAGATEPTAAQVAAAKATADTAAVDLASGKAWEDVAKAVCDGLVRSPGWRSRLGDLGDDTRWRSCAARCSPPPSTRRRSSIEGSDGTFRIGRVSEIAPATVDEEYEQKVADAGISISDYRVAVAADIRRQKLDDAITAGVVDAATPQRRVSEIYVAEAQGVGDQVKVRHILFAPNDNVDQAALQALAEDDPAWDQAKADAQVAYDKLKPSVGTPELDTEFEALAKAESDEPGADTSGGDLPYFTRDQLDSGFGDAIFAPGLKAGDLLGPVRSQFGWHVILFEDRKADPQGRIDTAKIRAEQAGGDFAAIAREVSEGPEATTGGDIGWVARLQLDKALEDAIFATPVGKTSDVVSVSGDGLYLFKVTEEQTRKPDADQAQGLRDTAFQNWYTQQKDAADITRETDLPQVTA